ncbi:hypothetical protein NC651_024075 [Populus alba x Populus x berolinensis]|nr:hypothetical protein NC651_024075 [Populus alba x Populus x berolinensis]
MFQQLYMLVSNACTSSLTGFVILLQRHLPHRRGNDMLPGGTGIPDDLTRRFLLRQLRRSLLRKWKHIG